MNTSTQSRSRKSLKGSLALGGAILLLTATGTTLAVWNDEVTLGSNSVITAGQLRVNSASAPVWKIAHLDGSEVPVADLSAVRIVPGDKLSFTMSAEIAAQGQNLRFKVQTFGATRIEADTPSAANTSLKNRLDAAMAFTVSGATAVPGETNVFEHKSNTEGRFPVTITGSVNWDFGDATTVEEDNRAGLGEINLKNMVVQVFQVAG